MICRNLKLLIVFFIVSCGIVLSEDKPFSSSNETEIGDLSKKKIKIEKPDFKSETKKVIVDLNQDTLKIEKIGNNVFSVNGNSIAGLKMVSFFEETNTYQIQTERDTFKISTKEKFSYDGKQLSAENAIIDWNNVFNSVKTSRATRFISENNMHTVSGNFAMLYEHSDNLKVIIDSTIDDPFSFAHCEEILDQKISNNTLLWIGRKNSDHRLVCKGNASAYVKFIKEQRNVFVKGNSDNVIFETDCSKKLKLLSHPPLEEIVKKYSEKMKYELEKNISILKKMSENELTELKRFILERRIKIEKENYDLQMQAKDFKVPFIVYADIFQKNIYVYLLSTHAEESNKKLVYYHKLKKRNADSDKGYFFFYDTNNKIIGEYLNGHVFSYENNEVSKLVLPTTRTHFSDEGIDSNISGYIADISNKRLLLREGKSELVNSVEKFIDIDYVYDESSKLTEICFSTASIDELEFPGLGVNADILRQLASTFDEKLLMSLSASVLQPGAVEYIRNNLKVMLCNYVQEYLLFPEMIKGNENYFENFLSKIGYDNLSEIVSNISMNNDKQSQLIDLSLISKIKFSFRVNSVQNRDMGSIHLILYDTKIVDKEKKDVEIFNYSAENIPFIYEFKGKKYNIFESIQKTLENSEDKTFPEMFATFEHLNKYIEQ